MKTSATKRDGNTADLALGQQQLFGEENDKRLRSVRQYVAKRTAASHRLEDHAAEIHLLAEMLVQDFRQTRIKLRDLELERRAAESERKGEKPSNQLYSEIQLFTRLKGGALEIYWQRVQRVIRRTGEPKDKYTYISRHGQSGYNLGLLNQYALPYERGLVHEAERRADMLRREWTSVGEQRRISRVLAARAIDKTLLVPLKLELPSNRDSVEPQPRTAE